MPTPEPEVSHVIADESALSFLVVLAHMYAHGRGASEIILAQSNVDKRCWFTLRIVFEQIRANYQSCFTI